MLLFRGVLRGLDTEDGPTMMCWVPSKVVNETSTCMVTIQYADEEDTCMVHDAEFPPLGNCKAVTEAVIMANNLHEEVVSHKMGRSRGVYGGRLIGQWSKR